MQHTRAPLAIEGLEPPGSDGPTLANFTAIRDFWIDEYDWYAVQSAINGRLKQFTTTVGSNGTGYEEPVGLHFVHHRSEREDAIPFLFVSLHAGCNIVRSGMVLLICCAQIHGWPGSFLEVENIIDRHTNPPNSSVPAFHVVAPSIPGFGFSPAPTRAGYGLTAAGHSFHALMQQLGYDKYVVQGGDIGAFVSVKDHRHCLREATDLCILPWTDTASPGRLIPGKRRLGSLEFMDGQTDR